MFYIQPRFITGLFPKCVQRCGRRFYYADGEGYDTISLTSDAALNLIQYTSGDGDDIIYGFDNKDTLTLDGLDFKTSYSKKNNAVSFKFDDGSVTLKEFSATTFHVNNSMYKITNGKFKACF